MLHIASISLTSKLLQGRIIFYIYSEQKKKCKSSRTILIVHLTNLIFIGLIILSAPTRKSFIYLLFTYLSVYLSMNYDKFRKIIGAIF